MIISVINHTNGLLSDASVQQAIRAVNRQIAEDFDPFWGMKATLKLEGQVPPPPGLPAEYTPHQVDMRGDAVIYLWHPTDVRGGLGYHSRNFLGIPYGFVFPDVSRRLGEPWTISLSHEALEMVADPEVNLLVMGPHPGDRRTTVFYWYEVCDAVQADSYLVDNVPVSNFVLPLYFSNNDEPGSRNDFLNIQRGGRSLTSFGVNPGGYTGFFNPGTGKHESFAMEGDSAALRRLQVKGQLQLSRRAHRYEDRTRSGISTTTALRNYYGGP